MNDENEILVPVEVVEATIEAVQEKQEQLADTAENIAEAALEGERGRRISDVERRIDECQTALNSLPEMLAAKTAELIQSATTALRLELSTEMNSLLSVAVAGLAQSPPIPSSIQPALEAETVVVEPTTAETPTPETLNVPDPEKKRRHRFL